MRAVIGIMFATFLLAGGALGTWMAAGPYSDAPSPAVQALGGGGVVTVPASERYDLELDLNPEYRLALGDSSGPFLDLYLNGSIVNEANLTFYGPGGPTLQIGANGTITFPGRVHVLNVTAATAVWPHDTPDPGYSCWDLDHDFEDDVEEDLNGDGVHDGFDCNGVEGVVGPQGPRGADFGLPGPRGEEGPPGFSGRDANVLLFDAVELPVPGPCPYGGRRVFTGIDDGQPSGIEGDEILQHGERIGSMELCYGRTGDSGPMGQPGQQGNNSHMLVVARPTVAEALPVCIAGGVLLKAGFDDGRGSTLADDGILSDPEVIATAPLCFGERGEKGPTGDQGITGPPGWGGLMGPKGANGTKGVTGDVGDQGASGANGFVLLTTVQPAMISTDCPTGGKHYRMGTDDGTGDGEPGDGVIHADELRLSFDICRGPRGPTGQAGTKWNHTVPANHRSHTLPDGGEVLDATLNTESWPVIAYRDATADELRLVRCQDVDCDSVIDARVSNSDSPGSDIALAMGIGNIPTIAYNNALGEIWLAQCEDETCVQFDFTLIVAGVSASMSNQFDMVIAGNGCPVVAYQLNGDLYTVSASPDSGCTTWTTTKLYQNHDAGYFPQMALAWSGNPVIAFWDETNGRAMTVTCTEASCTTYAIGQATMAIVDRHPVAIMIGMDGYPALLVEDRLNDKLEYVHCTDTLTCTGSTGVELAGGFQGVAAIAQGHDGRPAIIAEIPGVGLRFIKCHDLECGVTTQHTFGSAGTSAKLLMGFNELPVIVHQESGAIETIRLGSPYGPAYFQV